MNVTVYDNDGRTFDRYFVVLHDYGYALGIGPTGNVPNGFCMSIAPEEYVIGPHLGRIITIDEMLEPARLAVERELVWARKQAGEDERCACGRTLHADGTCPDGGAWCG